MAEYTISGTTPDQDFETGGGIRPLVQQGYSFEIPDFTEEIYRLRTEPDHKPVLIDIIKKHEIQRSRMLQNHRRYKTDVSGVPIFHRTFERDVTIDNRINNDYFSEIVDIKTGYFAGKPAAYSYDRNQANAEQVQAYLQDFLDRNRIADVNMETTKYCAIGGYAARLLYIDPDGRDRIMYIPGHQVVLLNEDGNITEAEYGIRYYGSPDKYVITFYDRTMRYKYQQDGGNLVELESNLHGFGLCPLIGYANNEELMGDVDKVLGLIDAIDRTTSDVNSEIEAFRMAYLLFMGYDIRQEDLNQMKRTGALGVSGNIGQERGDVRYIEKNLNDTAIENHLDRLHDSIYRFSGTPDLADEAFSGTQSGESLKFKLFGLETKCSRFEQKFKAADTRMFEVLATKWAISGVVRFDPYKVFAEFKRNFPQNFLAEAEVLMKLKGTVSDATLYGLASFIDDVQYEIDQKAKEDEERLAQVLNAGGSFTGADDA